MAEQLTPPQANRKWSIELRNQFSRAIQDNPKVSFAQRLVLLTILDKGSDATCHAYSRELTRAANP